MFATSPHMIEPFRNFRFYLIFIQTVAAQIIAYQISYRAPDHYQVIAHAEHLDIAAIPGNKLHFIVDDSNALINILDRCLQQFPTKLQTL